MQEDLLAKETGLIWGKRKELPSHLRDHNAMDRPVQPLTIGPREVDPPNVPSRFSFGYTSPAAPFEEPDHAAAFAIQTHYREHSSRRKFRGTMLVLSSSVLLSHINGPELPPQKWPEPTTIWGQRRRWVWVTCSEPSSSLLACLVTVIVLFAILVSCVMFVLETMPIVYGRHQDKFFSVELTCVLIFTIEFLFRVCSCPTCKLFRGDLLNWVDLASILPFYVELLLPDGKEASGFTVLRLIRLARVFRLLKLGRHSGEIKVFVLTFRESLQPLTTLTGLVLCAMVIIASIMYYIERGEWACQCGATYMKHCSQEVPCVNDDKNHIGYWVILDPSNKELVKSQFQSIPATLYFALVTMTTVGYGDVKPLTELGKFAASCFCISGVIVIAVPVSVISSSFRRNFYEMDKRREEHADEAEQQEEEAVNQRRHRRTKHRNEVSVFEDDDGDNGDSFRKAMVLQGASVDTAGKEMQNFTSAEIAHARSLRQVSRAEAVTI